GTLGRLSLDVRDALAGTAQLLRSLGHEVVERELPFGPRDARVILGLMFRGIRDLVAEVEQPQRLERRTRALARPGALVSDRRVEKLLAREKALASRLAGAFAEHDVWLTPVLSRPPARAGIMEGRGATVTYLWESGYAPFCILWNSTGQPAASVPAGWTADGLPLAVQLVGRPYDETTLLSLSAQLEAARPWADRCPLVS
ncbi:MAG TPA: amidase family protein, partial [Solirubrobacteraceae bacterium]|nr:amidase family protein [Solirubrobacteraceae bacterium]